MIQRVWFGYSSKAKRILAKTKAGSDNDGGVKNKSQPLLK